MNEHIKRVIITTADTQVVITPTRDDYIWDMGCVAECDQVAHLNDIRETLRAAFQTVLDAPVVTVTFGHEVKR